MDKIAHLVDHATHPALPVVILLTIVLWFGALVAAIRDKRARKADASRGYSRALYLCVGGFLVTICFVFLVGDFIKSEALSEIGLKLSSGIESVTIDGRPANKPAAIATALNQIRDVIGHHSQPTDSYHVELVTSRGILDLVIRRDSEVRSEYWVYDPAFYWTTSDSVGRIFTDALDGS